MPTPRPIYVSPYAEALLDMYSGAERRERGQIIRGRKDDPEVVIYRLEEAPALRTAAEAVVAALAERSDETSISDKRQMAVLLGILSVHENAEADYPYSAE